jgi:hypothetical protein
MASGLFTTPIDFGAGAFNGDARHLQIGVRCPAGVGSFTSLTTRQELTAAPYALYATNAGSAATLTGVLPTANGGTGLSSSGVAGRYLRSNGSIWTSSAIQVGDLPAGSAYYIQNSTLQQASANFNISGSGTLGGALNLPNTTSSSVGVINLGTNRFLHNKGFQNTFLGSFAGNLATTGTGNTAVGYTTLTYNTEGNSNAALGANALSSNTSGSNNTALGYAALNANDTGSENTGECAHRQHHGL